MRVETDACTHDNHYMLEYIFQAKVFQYIGLQLIHFTCYYCKIMYGGNKLFMIGRFVLRNSNVWSVTAQRPQC